MTRTDQFGGHTGYDIGALTDIGVRARACKSWQWMPEILGWHPNNDRVLFPIRFVGDGAGMIGGAGAGHLLDAFHTTIYGYRRSDKVVPDLSDPATRGCLLSLVHEARNNPTGFVVPERDGKWTYYSKINCADYWTASSEAEALVLALEEAEVCPRVGNRVAASEDAP